MSRDDESRSPDAAPTPRRKLLGRLAEALRRGPADPPGSLSDLLRRTGLFRHLDEAAFDQVCGAAQPVRYADAARIFEEGQPGSDLFVVRSGSVRILSSREGGEPVVLRRVEPGEYFGEQALLEDAPGRRTASAVALGDVELVRLGHEQFREVLRSSRKLAEALRSAGRRQLVETWMKRREIFACVEPRLVEHLSRHVREFADGERIFSQGDEADGAYLITDGEVEIQLEGATGEPVGRSRRGRGQVVGEVALLAGGRRTGSASARGPLRALFLERKRFLELHAANPAFERQLRDVEHFYRMPYRGVVSIGSGEYEGMECVTSVFHLDDGRAVIASRVRGEDVFVMSQAGVAGSESWGWSAGESRRELGVREGRIVSIGSFGPWPGLGSACALLLEGRPLEAWREALFRGNGVLELEPPAADAGLLCQCMKVSRAEVRAAIGAGCTELEAVSAGTGAGTVCGSCRGDIAEMLGDAGWLPVALERIVRRNDAIRSYRLQPFEGAMSPHEPGQHVVLQSLIAGSFVSRSYTLTSVPGDAEGYEITVKREEKGFFSGWLFEQDAQRPFLRVALPRGEGIHTLLGSGPVVCLVAGIGVTPAIALARALAASGSPQRLHVDYSARTRADAVFADELEKLCSVLPGLSLRLRLSSEQGRITAQEIAGQVRDFEGAGYFVCGPEGFDLGICQALAECGVPGERILTEHFVPAGGRL